MTTNGGTVWRNVPITYSQTTLYAAYALSPALGAAMITSRQAGACPLPHRGTQSMRAPRWKGLPP